MAEPGAGEDVLARYGVLQASFEHAGGYTFDTRVDQVLTGLGFHGSLRELPLAHLSGGQKTRVLLARLLLDQPDLLILDEPTNHLDVAASEWLEGTLAGWDGAVLVVSHDRYFLDRVVDHVWALGRDGVQSFRGNYSAYQLQRESRADLEGDLFASEIERLQRELDYVRRNIAGQNTSIATGRLKRLSRDIAALERHGVLGVQGKQWSELGIGRMAPFGVDEAGRRLNALRGPAGPRADMALRLAPARRGGDVVLRTQALQIGHPGSLRVAMPDVVLDRGQRVAIVGPNGAGKTTLLRTLLGELPVLGGEARLGGGTQVGYFAQAHDGLVADDTVLGTLVGQRGLLAAPARSHLARFLFQGDDVNKQVAMLSGGERARLALALLALDGANLLLLDEPTNHLDIPAQEVLESVLAEFDGTLILVSHDRYLMDRLATQVWRVDQGRVTVYDGSYQVFLAARDGDDQTERAQASAPAAERRADRAATRAAERTTQRQLAAIVTLEARIADLEAERADIEAALQAASERADIAEVTRLDARYVAAQGALDTAWSEWAAANEAVTVDG
jgi:ATP-binding cassette subfamily F protein 3